MARQSVAIAVLATQVIVPVKFPGEGDHWAAFACGKGGVNTGDNLSPGQRVIDFRRGRVKERSHGSAKQNLRGAASAGTTTKVQCLAQT